MLATTLEGCTVLLFYSEVWHKIALGTIGNFVCFRQKESGFCMFLSKRERPTGGKTGHGPDRSLARARARPPMRAVPLCRTRVSSRRSSGYQESQWILRGLWSRVGFRARWQQAGAICYMLHFAYFLEEFRGIPPREPPISGTRVTTNWAGERPTRHCQVRICTRFPVVSLFVLLSFLLPVRALLCGRLPHTAPLVLPARPRANKTTLLLSRHHTHTLLGGGSSPCDSHESRPRFLARYHEHRPAKQQVLRSEVNAHGGRHEIDRAVVAIHAHK